MSARLWMDLESTGLDPDQDRIVEIALFEEVGTGLKSVIHTLVNPTVPIPREVTKIHGIADKDVADSPTFADLAIQVQDTVNEARVLAGYNSRRFDTLLLDAELKRAGLYGIDLATVREIDAYNVWQSVEPRTLEGFQQRWCPGEAPSADHSGENDVRAAWKGLNALVRQTGLDPEQLEVLSKPEDEVDRHRRFVRREDGVIVFNFGKHKGQMAREHFGYLQWLLRADFAENTKAIARKILKRG